MGSHCGFIIEPVLYICRAGGQGIGRAVRKEMLTEQNLMVFSRANGNPTELKERVYMCHVSHMEIYFIVVSVSQDNWVSLSGNWSYSVGLKTGSANQVQCPTSESICSFVCSGVEFPFLTNSTLRRKLNTSNEGVKNKFLPNSQTIGIVELQS